VLSKLGYDDEQIAAFASQGSVVLPERP
jgi:hypothetical protein